MAKVFSTRFRLLSPIVALGLVLPLMLLVASGWTGAPHPLPTEPSAHIYYLSPVGNDQNSGAAPAAAWASFDRAWHDLHPGDTLILLDGVYRQTLRPNRRNGEPGRPITVRAQHDGQAIIEGDGVRVPVELDSYAFGPVGSYYAIEGIVARNSVGAVFMIGQDHNVLRRVSGYNANPDENAHVFTITANHTLLEDCVAAGTGRKMILIYGYDREHGNHNIIRRCFADWQAWDGRNFCEAWPWGDNIQVYNGSDNLIENSIGYGAVPFWSISVQANSLEARAVGNQVLGSMAINAGMAAQETARDWGPQRPGPTACTALRDFNWPGQRAGFAVFGPGELYKTLFRDVLAWGNAGSGLTALNIVQDHYAPVTLDHATIFHNGLDARPTDGEPGRDVTWNQLARFRVSNSWIEGTPHVGAGARLHHRYVDGSLTNQPLWPWPMEARIQAELDLSVTEIVTTLLQKASLSAPKVTNTSASAPVIKTPIGVTERLIRRINAPYFAHDIPTREMAIFWFGAVDGTQNHVNTRVGYSDKGILLYTHIWDRWLRYADAPSADYVSAWDAVTLYLQPTGSNESAAPLPAYRFDAGLNPAPERTNHQGAWRNASQGGEGSLHSDEWVSAPIPFTTETGWRGQGLNNAALEASGWTVSFWIPFASLGLPAAPAPGTVWQWALAVHDRDDEAGTKILDQTWPEALDPEQPQQWGQLAFGWPTYTPAPATPGKVVTLQQGIDADQVVDAHVGGHTTCGAELQPDLFHGWGDANYATYTQLNIQNQWDMANWACFSKAYFSFPLTTLPANTVIISATLVLHQSGGASPAATPSLIQALTVGEAWDETRLTWNNAPLALENVAAAWVPAIASDPNGPGVARRWDVSRAVAQAYARGQPLRLALYSADDSSESGKYFWSSEAEAANRPALQILWGEPSAP